MAKYRVEVDWHGYSRGYTVYEVEAESEEEAAELWFEGTEVKRETVRSDQEADIQEVKLIS